MSTNAMPPGGSIGLQNDESTNPEYALTGNEDSRRTTIFRIAQNIKDTSFDTGGYLRTLKPIFCFGYKPKSDFRYRVWNISIASALLIFAMPLLAILFILIMVDSGWPVIYKGARLGKNRKQFYIYKFRTLKPQAKNITVNQVLPARSSLETRIGKILRETRLDELPQIWNIIKGDMNLFGPRPVRQEIADIYDGKIYNYNIRFLVRPGLIGHVQAFLPHRSSKKLRAYYNHVLVKRPTCPWKEILFLVLVSSTAIVKLGAILTTRFGLMIRRGQFRELRATQRATPRAVSVYMVDADERLIRCGHLGDINDEVFSFQSEIDLPEQCYTVVLQGPTQASRRQRRAVCKAKIKKVKRVSFPRGCNVKGTGEGASKSYSYLAKYDPISEFQACLIDRYFAKRSFIHL